MEEYAGRVLGGKFHFRLVVASVELVELGKMATATDKNAVRTIHLVFYNNCDIIELFIRM